MFLGQCGIEASSHSFCGCCVSVSGLDGGEQTLNTCFLGRKRDWAGVLFILGQKTNIAGNHTQVCL